MSFHVERYYDAKTGAYYPDDQTHPNGLVAREKRESSAIKAYARRVLGGEDKLHEGDKFSIAPLGEEKTVRVKARSINVRFEDVPDE